MNVTLFLRRPWAILVLLVVSSYSLADQGKYGGGTGMPNDPFLIYTAEQMNEIGLHKEDWDKHFKLMDDIDLGEFTGTSFNIIGEYYVDWSWVKNPFTGVFDGNDHTISYFTYTSTGIKYVGLFGYVSGYDAEIKNLGLIEANVDAETGKVGLIVGYLREGNITNCYVEGGSVISSVNMSGGIGGLVGSNAYGTITNCSSSASVTGTTGVGGLVGNNQNYGTITNCYSSGSVTGESHVGDLVGYSNYHTTIINCYSTGSVSGERYVGGLVGYSDWKTTIIKCYSMAGVAGTIYVGGLVGYIDDQSHITNCYSTGSVTGDGDVGGLVGKNDESSVTYSFWDIETSGKDISAGGTEKTTTEMQSSATFFIWGLCGNEGIWTIDEGKDYPHLWWEEMPGEPIYTPIPSYGGGSGESNDPFLIYTAEQLNTIGLVPCHLSKYFKLMADIDLSGFTGTSFNLIGTNYHNPFTGVFDGNSHTISSFSFTSTDINNIGLFGYVQGDNANIKNIRLNNPNVDAGTGNSVGSLVGFAGLGPKITNCYIQGCSVTGIEDVGGLVGYNWGSTITNCYSTGSVTGYNSVGGLVGTNAQRTIANCYSTGNVSGDEFVGGLVGNNSRTITDCLSTCGVTGTTYVGGLVGLNYSTVTNSYSTGSVEGMEKVGGLVGYTYKGSIINCYSAGSVSGNSIVGGLVGYSDRKTTVTYCYWDIEKSGQATSAGGTGLTTAQMQKATTFLVWACEPVWTIDEGNDYPRLVWENIPGELIIPPSYGGGCGEPNDPYLIYTAEQLNSIGLVKCHWDLHFKLMADIDLNSLISTSFNVIGSDYDNRFRGVFDGNGYTISNLTCTSTGTTYTGLFGYVHGFNAEIINLGLINPIVGAGGRRYVGSLVGYLYNGAVTNCYVEGGIVCGGEMVGSLVGNVRDGTITNCYATGIARGSKYVGGLVGYNDSSTITTCYAVGSVSGDESVGGLVGYDDNGIYGRSFWDRSVNPDFTGVGNITDPYGVMGRTSSEMKTQRTFTDKYWDFVGETANGTEDFWYMAGCGYSYPVLSWQPVWIVPDVNGLSETDAANVITSAGPFIFIKTDHSELVPEGYVISQEPPAGCDAAVVTIIVSGGFPYEAGSGTETDPYQIWTPYQMNAIGAYPDDWDKQFVLMSDIDLSDYTDSSFNIIGNSRKKFSGVFDGNGHTISNFTYISSGTSYVSLFGFIRSNGKIRNLGLADVNINAGTGSSASYVGGLVAFNDGTITNCYATGSVRGRHHVGGLAGRNDNSIRNCYAAGSVSGRSSIGNLVGRNSGRITNCYAMGDVSGKLTVGGLVAWNSRYGNIWNCYSTGSVSGTSYHAGGLVAVNDGSIKNCYATGSVNGDKWVGGLVGENRYRYITSRITNCYSTGSVDGNSYVGGLVGENDTYSKVLASFWDIDTSGQTISDGGTGLKTYEMQTISTFMDAGWNFVYVWWIFEGVSYPRHLWEIPVLHTEPDITLGANNRISWEIVTGDVEYYAECSEDENFTSIVYNSGWITETSCEFVGLDVGKRYWYSVKARNSSGIESSWSNVESSLQCNLAGAVEIKLEPESLKNTNAKNALLNKINEVLKMIDEGLYQDALNKLRNDILQKTNGCAETGEPDKNDWIISCEQQSEIYSFVIDTIEHVSSFIGQSPD